MTNRTEVRVSCPIARSFRVEQVAGLFGLNVQSMAAACFAVDVPARLLEPDADWRVGLIVGPSGSGKTSIARHLFGPSLVQVQPWPHDAAVVDGLGDLPIRRITGLFLAVGFSSTPAWVKPYRVLSGGEQFRCDLARALATAELQQQPRVVFDEFTSVVDRNVAMIGSAAVAAAIRNGRVNTRFVAVTCHYDVEPWLAPDWILDMASNSFRQPASNANGADVPGRGLRRPSIHLQLFRCHAAAWRLFARHHYLSDNLNPLARCFLVLWQGVPVAFCATLPLIGRKLRWRISRLVVLPDYQGVGIGGQVAATVAQLHQQAGHRVSVTAGHPALLAHCQRSPAWRAVNVQRTGSRPRKQLGNYRGSRGRALVSFEYIGETGHQ